MAQQLEACIFGDTLLELFELVVEKLHYLAALDADEVVVVTPSVELILFAFISKKDGAYQLFLLEKGEGAIDRGDPHGAALLFDLLMDLLWAKVAGGIVEDLEDRFTLLGVFEPPTAHCLAEFFKVMT